MSTRSKARKAALDLLYESDIRGLDPITLLEARVLEHDVTFREYTAELIRGVSEHRKKIDELIVLYAKGWDMDRMPAVDRNILRIAIFELLWSPEIPDKVAIDEALVLAKELSTDDSVTYINGVLGSIHLHRDDIAI